MVDYLTEEQLAYQTMAREFAEREIKPIALELDRIANVEEIFPWDLVKKGSRIGLRTIALPKEYGGQGIDLLTQLVMIDELAFADMSCSKIFSQCWKLSQAIAAAGTREQCAKFLPPFRDDDTFLLAVAFTEPDYGSDNVLPFDDPTGGLMLAARSDGGHYILNGVKHFISLANVAKLVIVCGRTDRTVGITRGASAFLVPRDSPGLSVGKVQDKMGWRAYVNAELIFNQVKVPKENLLGDKEGLAHIGAVVLGHSNLEAAAHVLAGARAAYEAALAYARQRVQGGRPIIEHQAVALLIAEMFVDLQAGRTLLWQTARLASNGPPDPLRSVSAQALGMDVALRVVLQSLEIHGGMGVMKGMPIEKYVRDILSVLHGGGTRQINRLKIANFLAAQAV